MDAWMLVLGHLGMLPHQTDFSLWVSKVPETDASHTFQRRLAFGLDHFQDMIRFQHMAAAVIWWKNKAVKFEWEPKPELFTM